MHAILIAYSVIMKAKRKNLQKLLILWSSFPKLFLALKDRPIKEIQFSGGDPFLNGTLTAIKMIEWAHKNTDYEFGLLRNLSLLNEPLIMRLSKTRVTLNIQFPSSKKHEYYKITKSQEANIY